MNYLQQTEKEEVKYWISHNLANYLQDNNEDVSEIEHIIDYLNSDKAPKRLKKMSYQEAKNAAEQWLNSLAKKGRGLIDLPGDVEVTIDFKDGFKLVKLISKKSYDREGTLMAHCVSSYYDKEDNAIYSLRDSNNKPHCTLSVVNRKGDQGIEQIKGKGNGHIDPKYIQYILEALKFFGLSVRDTEMYNLGYIMVDDDYISLANKFYRSIPLIVIDNTKYIYCHKRPLLRV